MQMDGIGLTANDSNSSETNGTSFIHDVENNDSDNDENSDTNHTPEYFQRKLYFLLEHLKKMHSELPE